MILFLFILSIFILEKAYISQIVENKNFQVNHKEIKIKINQFDLNVLLAETYTEQARGLMFKNDIYFKEKNIHGMLFIYEKKQNVKFWMKNTYVNLDLLLLDENKKIIEIIKMEKNSLKIISSIAEAKYALELIENKNLIFKVGDQVKFNLEN